MIFKRKTKSPEELIDSTISFIKSELAKVGEILTEEEEQALRDVIFNNVLEKGKSVKLEGKLRFVNPEKVLKDAPSVLALSYYNAEDLLKVAPYVVKFLGKDYDPTPTIAWSRKIPESFYKKWMKTEAFKKYERWQWQQFLKMIRRFLKR